LNLGEFSVYLLKESKSWSLSEAEGGSNVDQSIKMKFRSLSEAEGELILNPMKAYMYILQCSDGHYYTGSTNDLERRIKEHLKGQGANFTSKHLPARLMYYEEFARIEDAYFREKQIQGWSRRKKEALINQQINALHMLSKCQNESSSDLWHQKIHPSASLRER